MEIVWDEPKRLANVEKHAMDFADLTPEFFVSAIVRPSHSERFLALGHHGDDPLIAVVFRALGTEAVSIISMRPASPQERKLFDG